MNGGIIIRPVAVGWKIFLQKRALSIQGPLIPNTSNKIDVV